MLDPTADPLHVHVAALPHWQRLVWGMLPLLATAMVAASGDIYYGLWYLIGVAVMSLVIGTLFLQETKDTKIHSAG